MHCAKFMQRRRRRRRDEPVLCVTVQYNIYLSLRTYLLPIRYSYAEEKKKKKPQIYSRSRDIVVDGQTMMRRMMMGSQRGKCAFIKCG